MLTGAREAWPGSSKGIQGEDNRPFVEHFFCLGALSRSMTEEPILQMRKLRFGPAPTLTHSW